VPGVVAPTVSVRVELPPAATDAGLNEAVVPDGRPLALIAMLSALPLVTVVEIVEAAVVFCSAETLLGPALIEKSFRTMTVSETLVVWVALAAVPVTVTVYVPGVVPMPAARVSVEVPPAATEAGLKEAVVPEGRPLALSVTVSAVPPARVVEIVEVVAVPWVAETLAGFALIEKSFGTVTESETVVLCVLLVAVPVTVIGYVPVIVEASTVKVSVELPPAVTDAGLKEALTPAGNVPVLKAMLWALPLVIPVEIVDEPVPPCATETEPGFALMEKSFGGGGAVTVRFTLVECVALAAVPVTVIGYVPGVVAAPTVSVSVEPPPAVTEAGLNAALTPAGRAPVLSATDSAVPLTSVVEIVEEVLLPCCADTLVGLALIEKSFVVAPQPGSLKVPIRVRQLNAPLLGMYSFAYQKVQPSTGSMLIEL